MMKKLIALGTVLGAAAYLQNKDRRDRLMSQGRDLLDSVKHKARNLKADAKDERLFSDSDLGSTTTDPGYRPPPPPRTGGMY